MSWTAARRSAVVNPAPHNKTAQFNTAISRNFRSHLGSATDVEQTPSTSGTSATAFASPVTTRSSYLMWERVSEAPQAWHARSCQAAGRWRPRVVLRSCSKLRHRCRSCSLEVEIGATPNRQNVDHANENGRTCIYIHFCSPWTRALHSTRHSQPSTNTAASRSTRPLSPV